MAGAFKDLKVLGIFPRKTGSHETHRWRELDSNFGFGVLQPLRKLAC
jgi:hypothetical protein